MLVGCERAVLMHSSPELCVGVVDAFNAPANHAYHVVYSEVVVVLGKDAIPVPSTHTKRSEYRRTVQISRVTSPQRMFSITVHGTGPGHLNNADG